MFSKLSIRKLVICFFILILLSTLIGILLVKEFNDYNKNNKISYETLTKRELTFIESERISVSRGSSYVLMYFKEYDTPFYIKNTALTILDHITFQEINLNDSIICYYDYDLVIYELVINNHYVLNLTSYKEELKNESILLLSFISVAEFISLFMAILVLCKIVKKSV